MGKRTMEELFETMPPVPEGFKEGCMKYASPAPIYYRRKGHDMAECTCGKCGKQSIVYEVPERDMKTYCSVCKTEGLYEWKRCTRPKTELFTVVLVQKRTDNNIVLRHFKCVNTYKQGSQQQFSITEVCRQFMDMGDWYKFNRADHWDYKKQKWTMSWSTGQAGITYADVLYPGDVEALKESNFKYFKQGYGGFIEELKAYARNPALEMFQKMGLNKLRDDLVENGGVSKYVNRRGKNLKAQLRLKDKQRINYLVKRDGGLVLLAILQMEERNGIRLKDEQRDWIATRMNSWGCEEAMNRLLKYIPVQKMINKVNQYAESKRGVNKYWNATQEINRVLIKYGDYIGLREELGYDMTNTVFLFPKDLDEKHDEMVAEKNAIRDAQLEIRNNEVYKGIRERYEKLNRKYGWKAAGLLIRPARYAGEIMAEGRTLHHCVGRDAYLRKHDAGESIILFLRRVEEPEKPYCTIEIKGKEIVQWYGLHDGKPDIEVIGPWLNSYILHLGGTQAVYVAPEGKSA